MAAGLTLAIAGIKNLVNLPLNNGVDAADQAIGAALAPMWASKDLKRGVEAMARGQTVEHRPLYTTTLFVEK